jgi:hypothetical protein
MRYPAPRELVCVNLKAPFCSLPRLRADHGQPGERRDSAGRMFFVAGESVETALDFAVVKLPFYGWDGEPWGRGDAPSRNGCD